MFNAASKSVLLSSCIALASLAASCGGSGVAPGAEALCKSIDSATAASDYATAILLLDSLDSAYPQEVKLRIEMMKQRPAIMEGLTINEIAQADSALASAKSVIDSLSPLFEHVENKALVENYYVAKAAGVKNLMGATAIEPRLDEEYAFYVIASLQGKTIGLNSLRMTIDGTSATTEVIPEGDERSIKGATGQKAVFSGKDVDALGELAAANPGKSATLTFVGRTGSKDITLTPAQTTAFADTYRYSRALNDLRFASMRREKLERQLQIARNQKANVEQ